LSYVLQSGACLVLGTSLQIYPAADLVTEVRRKKGPVIIVNYQVTAGEVSCENSGGGATLLPSFVTHHFGVRSSIDSVHTSPLTPVSFMNNWTLIVLLLPHIREC
jgi:hypothetical protein